MLSRTAASLYWLGRYIERAENLARTLEAGYRMSQMPQVEAHSARNEWHSAAIAAASEEELIEKHGEATLDSIISYIVLDAENASSIYTCIKTARTNGRAVRTALTTEMWEALNDTWLEIDGTWSKTLSKENFMSFLEWIKLRTTLFRGALEGTMLRDEAYAFLKLGAHIECADNTARILDVKFHILLPPGEEVGGSADYTQWATVLRSVSALGSYHWIYRDSIKPWYVAELLILKDAMPRSLVKSHHEVVKCLEFIANVHGKRYRCHRLAGKLHSELSYTQIDDIFKDGLHEYLTEFLKRNNALGTEIAENYHFYF